MDEKQRELAAARERLDQLLKQIIELRRLLDQLAQDVKKAEGNAAKVSGGQQGMRDELATLQNQISKLEMDLSEQKEQLAQLEKELDERKKPPEEAEVSILPSGSGLGFEPVFIECSGGAVVLHQDDKLPRIRAADLAQDETFLKLLTQVAAAPKQTIVFLVRDNGLGTYRTARELADQHEARNGKLPVIGQGRLDLGYFNKKD
jgi:DNA repair exonuclease SbcCD ATPase subunit